MIFRISKIIKFYILILSALITCKCCLFIQFHSMYILMLFNNSFPSLNRTSHKKQVSANVMIGNIISVLHNLKRSAWLIIWWVFYSPLCHNLRLNSYSKGFKMVKFSLCCRPVKWKKFDKNSKFKIFFQRSLLKAFLQSGEKLTQPSRWRVQ